MVAGRVLPTFTPEEIELHNSTKSCSVTVGLRVYDLTPFLDGHPGGRELILEYAGQDVKKILRNPISHEHSATAYEVLKENLVGFLAPGSNGPSVNGAQPAYGSTEMRLVEDRSIETASENTHTHEFLDLNKPLFAQLWYSGFSKEFYLEQIHHPRHYKVGESAPIFGNFLEPLTKTAWYVVPIIWLPPVVYGTYLGFAGMGSASPALSYWIFGFFLWSFIEYAIHRFLFHIDCFLPDNRVGITLHFLVHGFHHYLPMDKYRLVMPPALFFVLASPFWKLAQAVFFYNWYAALIVYCGGIFGYVCYDVTHYFLHHYDLPLYYKQLKKYHLQHHFADFENGFGVTSRFWDWVFGTGLEQPRPKRL